MYLSQLLIARLVEREMMQSPSACFETSLLRVPLLLALDRAWGSVIRVRPHCLLPPVHATYACLVFSCSMRLHETSLHAKTVSI